jgi:imidazolonepropionase
MAQLIMDIGELLTLQPAMAKGGRRVLEADLGILKNHAMYIEKGQIAWIGPQKKIPKALARPSRTRASTKAGAKPASRLKEISCNGQTVLPGFIECHTHTVFAGHRAAEFEMRNQGVSYQEINRRGGGILSTMKNTRAASEKDLQQQSQARVDRFVAQGVTTLEIKSGYGLDLKSEIKMLKVAKNLRGPKIVTTFLGAHAKPPEFASYIDYLDFLRTSLLPKIRRDDLARRVDIFIEKGFFEKDAAKVFLSAAKEMGFEIVIHADQLTLSGGASLGVELQALSSDHLLQVGAEEIARLANSEVTCVLLPAADLYMKTAYPKAREMIDAGARVALATDFNPGSSPTQDLGLVGLLARLEMKMTLPEVIAAYTVGAAHALHREAEVGSLEVGKSADFICTDLEWQELFYSVGHVSPRSVYRDGKSIY